MGIKYTLNLIQVFNVLCNVNLIYNLGQLFWFSNTYKRFVIVNNYGFNSNL